MEVVHRNSSPQIMLSFELVFLQRSSPLLEPLPSLFTLPLSLFLSILSLPPPFFLPFVELDEGAAGFRVTVKYGPRSSIGPVRPLGDGVLEYGNRCELLFQVFNQHEVMIFGKIGVVVPLGIGITFCGCSVEAFVLEELRKRLLVAFGRSGVGRSRVCPGLVGGGQGTALTAFDHRREFSRTPDLLSDGDGICSNVHNLRINVFAKDARGSEIEPLETASDNNLPITELHRTSQ